MKEATLGIKLDSDTRLRLKRFGLSKDRSPHWLVKQAIAQYLEREERAERERVEDERRWAAYETTNVAYDHSDVSKWLNRLGKGEVVPWPK